MRAGVRTAIVIYRLAPRLENTRGEFLRENVNNVFIFKVRLRVNVYSGTSEKGTLWDQFINSSGLSPL